MDKKADTLLKRAWDATGISFRPALATTCVARTLEIWLSQLGEAVAADTSKEMIEESLTVLQKAVSYVADASVEGVRCSARTSALVNSTRRALWLKSWHGDCPFEVKALRYSLHG